MKRMLFLSVLSTAILGSMAAAWSADPPLADGPSYESAYAPSRNDMIEKDDAGNDGPAQPPHVLYGVGVNSDAGVTGKIVLSEADISLPIHFKVLALSIDRQKAATAGAGTAVWPDAQTARDAIHSGKAHVLKGGIDQPAVIEFLERLYAAEAATRRSSHPHFRAVSGRKNSHICIPFEPLYRNIGLQSPNDLFTVKRIELVGTIAHFTPVIDGDQIQLRLSAKHDAKYSELVRGNDANSAAQDQSGAEKSVRVGSQLEATANLRFGETLIVTDAARTLRKFVKAAETQPRPDEAGDSADQQKEPSLNEAASKGLMLIIEPTIVKSAPFEEQSLARVVVRGNKKVSTEAILNRAQLPSNWVASPDQIQQIVRNVYETGWFGSVNPKIETIDAGPVLVLHVTEQPAETAKPSRKHVRDKAAEASEADDDLHQTVRDLRRDVQALQHDVQRLIEILEKREHTDAAAVSESTAPPVEVSDKPTKHEKSEVKWRRRGTFGQLETERKLAETRGEFQFANKSLREVVQAIHEAGVSVALDPQGLKEEGLSPDTPVTLDILGPVSLRTVLNALEQSMWLGSRIDADGTLVITGRLRAQGGLIVVTYPVADLVIPAPTPGDNRRGKASPMADFNSHVERQLTAHQGAGGKAAPTTKTNFNSLADLIINTVEPNSWSNVGGHGHIHSFETTLSLVVRQTPRVHDEIRDLLEQLRRLQSLQCCIESRIVTGVSQRLWKKLRQDEAVGAALERLAEHGRCTILTDEELAALVETVQNDSRANLLIAPKITLFNGQSSGQTLTTELAGDAAGGQEIPLVLQIRPTISSDNRYVRLSIDADSMPTSALATVPGGRTLLVDLTRKSTNDRTLLLVKPQAVIEEEEERLLEVPVHSVE
jgi:hypothetical protein